MSLSEIWKRQESRLSESAGSRQRVSSLSQKSWPSTSENSSTEFSDTEKQRSQISFDQAMKNFNDTHDKETRGLLRMFYVWIIAMALIAILLLLGGCAFVQPGGQAQVVTSINVCLVGLCESADAQERIGDPSAGGNVTTSDQFERDTRQDETGDPSLTVPVPGWD